MSARMQPRTARNTCSALGFANQGDAWADGSSGFAGAVGDPHRTPGMGRTAPAMQTRVVTLFARSDEHYARLDALSAA